jgi:RNA polymerase sigma factor (sigma-70 family)
MHTLGSVIRLVHDQGAPPPERGNSSPSDGLLELLRLTLRGDRGATHGLLVALAPHLLRGVAGVLGRNDPDVEDIAQEAALVLLDVLPNFRGESSVVRFATRTAVLVAMNARRRRAAQKRGGSTAHAQLEIDEFAALPNGPDAALARARAADAVRLLLLRLPPGQAEALALHCISGCTLAEIAAATSAPLQTVKSRLRLARRALRQLLDQKPALVEVLEVGDEL